MRRAAAILLVSLATLAASPGVGVRAVTLLHFSDYHSHAVPYTLDGERRAAGIARALAYLRSEARDGGSLVLGGGDMLNRGAPAWSDKYGCAEWPWLNGVVAAAAFGNHDADYGAEAFARCRERLRFPILSANTRDAEGKAVFLREGKPYAVFERNGVRLGVFAVAGGDFDRLVAPERRPVAGASFGDPVEAARGVVAALRGPEKVDAVVLIGHEHHEADEALARAVPGIDVIFGSHSHRKEELRRIPGTDTWTISPFQYLGYVSRVELEVRGGRVSRVKGGLVKMRAGLPEDPGVARDVAAMQAALERDPAYAALFKVIGSAAEELSIDGLVERDAPFPDLVLDAVRLASGADVALLTASSFREPIQAGEIVEEALRTALPYPNRVLEYEIEGSLLQRLLDLSASSRGSDAFSQVSGVRFEVKGGKAAGVRVGASFAALEPRRRYRVALSDYQALTAPGYHEILADLRYRDTGLEVRELVRRLLRDRRPVTARRDGRIGY